MKYVLNITRRVVALVTSLHLAALLRAMAGQDKRIIKAAVIVDKAGAALDAAFDTVSYASKRLSDAGLIKAQTEAQAAAFKAAAQAEADMLRPGAIAL
jgi:hypothetical protein